MDRWRMRCSKECKLKIWRCQSSHFNDPCLVFSNVNSQSNSSNRLLISSPEKHLRLIKPPKKTDNCTTATPVQPLSILSTCQTLGTNKGPRYGVIEAHVTGHSHSFALPHNQKSLWYTSRFNLNHLGLTRSKRWILPTLPVLYPMHQRFHTNYCLASQSSGSFPRRKVSRDCLSLQP